jgi:hypothetical protein
MPVQISRSLVFYESNAISTVLAVTYTRHMQGYIHINVRMKQHRAVTLPGELKKNERSEMRDFKRNRTTRYGG